MLPSFYRLGNWGINSLNNLSKVSQLIGDEAGTLTQGLSSESLLLITVSILFHNCLPPLFRRFKVISDFVLWQTLLDFLLAKHLCISFIVSLGRIDSLWKQLSWFSVWQSFKSAVCSAALEGGWCLTNPGVVKRQQQNKVEKPALKKSCALWLSSRWKARGGCH